MPVPAEGSARVEARRRVVAAVLAVVGRAPANKDGLEKPSAVCKDEEAARASASNGVKTEGILPCAPWRLGDSSRL